MPQPWQEQDTLLEMLRRLPPRPASREDSNGREPLPEPDAFGRARAWLEKDPNRVYGSVLPISVAKEGGDIRISLSDGMRDTARGVVDLAEGPRTGRVSPEGTMALVTAVTPNAVARPDGSELGIFIGPRARTFSAQRAADLRHGGYSPEEVFAETRVFRGVDGRYRQEVPDHTSTIRPEAWNVASRPGGARMTLEELYDHPDLYRAYPQARGMETYVHPGGDTVPQMPAAGGVYYPPGTLYGSSGTQGVISVAGRTPAEMRSILGHEVQHYVQGVEGFVPGANMAAPMVVQRAQERVARAVAEAQARRKAALDRYDFSGAVNEELQIRYGKTPEAMRAEQHHWYSNAGGEIEARQVQRRLDMIPQERAALPPWQDLDDMSREPWHPGTGADIIWRP
jgi:hypothetical protein